MKYLVIGGGAIGGSIAAYLTKAEKEVTGKTGCKPLKSLQPASYIQATEKPSEARHYRIKCCHIILYQHNKCSIR